MEKIKNTNIPSPPPGTPATGTTASKLLRYLLNTKHKTKTKDCAVLSYKLPPGILATGTTTKS